MRDVAEGKRRVCSRHRSTQQSAHVATPCATQSILSIGANRVSASAGAAQKCMAWMGQAALESEDASALDPC